MKQILYYAHLFYSLKIIAHLFLYRRDLEVLVGLNRTNIVEEFSSLTSTFSLPLVASTCKPRLLAFLDKHKHECLKVNLFFYYSISNPNELVVRLGEFEFSKPSNSRQDFAVDAIFMHEEFSRRTLENDIAVIRPKEKVTFNNMMWAICLPPSNMDYSVLEGQSAYVTGKLFNH